MSKNITVVGVGKLGLGLALLIEKAGYNVLGVDINKEYVDKLNDKTFKTTEPEYENLLKNSKNFTATTDLQEGLNFSDYIYILVQTPNGGGHNFYDHTILSNLLYKINSYKPKNKHFIVGCTVMPKYLDTIAKELIKDCDNSNLLYNPEFVAQGEIIRGFSNSSIILIGCNIKSVNTEPISKLMDIYNNMGHDMRKIKIMSLLESEVVKIGLNGYITTKLSFANMLSDVCDEFKINKFTVLDAIGSDSRIGNSYFKPGFSFGGPCFPRDTQALKQVIDNLGINTDLLKGTKNYNDYHVLYQTNQLLKQNKDEYICENVCYKEKSDINIIEESAKLKIACNLLQHGKKVIIKDNKLVIDEVRKAYGNIFSYIITDQ